MTSRKSNFHDDEMETFLQEMEKNYVKICKASSLDPNTKSKIWDDIAQEVNAVSSITREPGKLMKNGGILQAGLDVS